MSDLEQACDTVLLAVHRLTMRSVPVISGSLIFPLTGVDIPSGYGNVILNDLVRRGLIYSPSGIVGEFGTPQMTPTGFSFLVENGYIDTNGREIYNFEAEDDIAPASDRIVHLTDNQRVALSVPLEDVIFELEKNNGDPDEPGLRERLLGQLKAGRELISAGVFKFWLFEQTVLTVLGGLVAKYGPTALGVAAKKALELFVEAIAKAP